MEFMEFSDESAVVRVDERCHSVSFNPLFSALQPDIWNVRNLALQSFFSFLWEPLFSPTLEFSPSKTWKSCQSTGALWVLSPAALNPAFSVSFSLTHTHTYIRALAPSPLLPFFASLSKPSWEFRGSLPFSLWGFLSASVSSNELRHAACNP